MASVTSRCNDVKQPRGGYIKPSQFECIPINDGVTLNAEENIHGSIIGMVVDYMTRFLMGTEKEEAFRISLKGAEKAEKSGVKDAKKIAKEFVDGITDKDEVSVINACKLVTFDVWFRNPINAKLAKGYNDTNPDKATIENIQTLINRSLSFFKTYGPIVYDGFTFEPKDSHKEEYLKMIVSRKGSYGGYTATVESGDGDFLTSDTMWDYKVSKAKPTNKHTLQLLMYWIMGQHSGQKKFKNITRLGIYNPRLNTVYLLDINKVPQSTIESIEKEVICYE